MILYPGDCGDYYKLELILPQYIKNWKNKPRYVQLETALHNKIVLELNSEVPETIEMLTPRTYFDFRKD